MNATKRAHHFMIILSLYMLAGQVLLQYILVQTNSTLSLTQSGLISQYILILLPCLLYFVITKSSITQTLHLKKVNLLDLVMSIGIALFIIPLMTLINILSQLFAHNYLQDYIEEINSMPYLLLIFLMAVTPGIVEEIAFRGIILKNYRNQTVLVTCIINGFLFGMFHGNLNQFSYAFLLGIVFSYVMHLTGSIIPAMVMHFTINASNLTFQRVMFALSDLLSEANPEFAIDPNAVATTGEILLGASIILVVVIATLPFALLLLYYLGKRNNKTHLIKGKAISGVILGDVLPEEVITTEKWFNPSFVFLLIYFIGYIVAFEFILPVLWTN